MNEDEVDDDMFSEIISENDDVFDFLNADAEETEAVAEETEDEIVDEVITDPVAIADELAAKDDAEEFVPIEFESFTDEEFQHHSDDKY